MPKLIRSFCAELLCNDFQSIFFQASLSSLSAPTSWEPRSLSISSGHTPIHVLTNLLRAIRKLLVSYPNTAWMHVYGPPCQVCEHNTIIMLWHWCIFGLLSSYHIMEPNKSSMAWLNAVLLPAVVPSAAPESLRRTTCTADSSFSLILLCSHVVPSSAF